MKEKNNIAAHTAALGANLFFGGNFSAMKYVIPAVIAPFALNGLRVLFATSLFWLCLLATRKKFAALRKPLDKKDIPRLIVCGITGVSINQLLLVKGLSYTTAVHGSLLMLVAPIFIVVASAFILKERLSSLKLLGLVFGIVGACVLIFARNKVDVSATNIPLGDTLIILNAISYSIYFVYVKPLMQRYSAMQVITWVFTIGVVGIMPFAWGELQHTIWENFTIYHWVAVSFTLLFATFGAYLLTIYSIANIGPGASSAYIYTQPFFAALVAYLVYHDTLDATKITASVLIFLGVYLVNKKKRQLT